MTRGLEKECQSWLDDALARVQALAPVEGEAAQRRKVRVAKGQLAWGYSALVQGEKHVVTRARLREALALAEQSGDERLLTQALRLNALAAIFEGDSHTSRPLAEESLALARKIGDDAQLALGLIALGQFEARLTGDLPRARAYLEEGVQLLREKGAARELALAHFGLAFVTLHQEKDYAEARRRFELAERLFSAIGDRHFATGAKSGRADVARHEGNYAEATALYRETITVWREFGHRGAIARCLECLGFIASAQGDANRAARLMGAADALRAASDSQMTPEERPEYERELATLRSKLDPHTFDDEWNAGHDLTMEQAIALAFQDYELERNPNPFLRNPLARMK